MQPEDAGELECAMIGPFIESLTSSHQTPVTTEHCIVIALYKLATCAEYRVVGETFSVRKTTVHRCVYVLCQAIREKLMSRYIKLSDMAEAQQIALHNHSAHHVPQVHKVLDDRHIPVFPPADRYQEFVNSKGWHPSFYRHLLTTTCSSKICV